MKNEREEIARAGEEIVRAGQEMKRKETRKGTHPVRFAKVVKRKSSILALE